MLLEAGVSSPAALPLVDAGIFVVPVEQMLAARIRRVTELFKKRGKLGMGDRPAIDPERRERDGMCRPLVSKAPFAAHEKCSTRQPHHGGFRCRPRAGDSSERKRAESQLATGSARQPMSFRNKDHQAILPEHAA